MSERLVKIVMFAGMGAGLCFVEPQKRAFEEALIVPRWPRHREQESVSAYAARWADALRMELPRRALLVLVGVSFGGMIALEAAERLSPRAVLLIASARCGCAVAPLWRGLERLASPVPWGFARPFAPTIGYLHGIQMGLDGSGRRVLMRVARQLDLSLAQWCARGVTHWEGLSSQREAQLPPVWHIHGDRDPLIPITRVTPDAVVHGGKHMIHLSHADRINAWIKDRVQLAVTGGNDLKHSYGCGSTSS